MSTSLELLLPAPEQSVRCAEHARSISVDPGGTAIRADRVVVVATPTPWPKPALDHPLLVELSARLRGGPVPTRLLAAVPGDGGPGETIVYERAGASATEAVYRLALGDREQMEAFAERLTTGQDTGPEAVERHPVARPAVLICTQGTHDVCCGSEGMRFAEAVERPDGPFADLRVFRVSHTGGHRFAPTGMTLPDGRMWASLDDELLAAIVTRSDQVAGQDLTARCRGWWGAENGPAQVAERAVLAELGWAIDDRDRTVDPEPAPSPTPATPDGVASPSPSSAPATPDGVASGTSAKRVGSGPGRVWAGVSEAATAWIVTVGDRQWRIVVAVGREVPTIACRQPGGQPVKPGREYRIVSMVEL